MLIDTHCHIQFQGYNADRASVIERCQEKNMAMVLVGTQRDTSRAAVELAEQYECMYASIATHPVHLHPTHIDEEESHFLSREESFDTAHYESLAASPKVIAVGETGLDLYHLPAGKTVDEVLQKQIAVFMDHVTFALKHDLSLIIHCRDGLTPDTARAHDTLIKLLRELNRPIRGTVHCFTSGWNHAKAYLDLGLHLGFTGVITFPPKKTNPAPQVALNDVVEKIPLDRVVVETDSPYLAPQRYRGERAEPWMVEEVVKTFAERRGLSYEAMEEIIAENTLRLFPRMRRHL